MAVELADVLADRLAEDGVEVGFSRPRPELQAVADKTTASSATVTRTIMCLRSATRGVYDTRWVFAASRLAERLGSGRAG